VPEGILSPSIQSAEMPQNIGDSCVRLAGMTQDLQTSLPFCSN